ncbi:MAG: T9SS type A sorting domain-containing protein [Flammeovirgaceae bacterium]|nr:T9SS type A sorting domain-containing protein [Flammeovirgaceae bacterium]
MDYSDDACMNIFTEGQKTRIQAVMEMSPRRKTLIDANLCSPIIADVPTANFTSDKQLVLKGGEIIFTDLSTNFPTSWAWVFEGGDPATSTERNPKINYNIPGLYTVSLISTNSLGPSLIKEIVGYVTVSEEGLCSSATNFLAGYTPSLLPLSSFGSYTGYLTGHNSLKTKAVSEFFKNAQGYEYVSGVEINFGYVYASSEEATVTITVWNARGPQNAPGSVVEQKVVLLKQIQDDIDNNQATSIVFDRETPVFSRPYQIGVEFNYADGDTVAITSSANGEANNATSWLKDASGVWTPYSIALGANIAMSIRPIVGVNPSVQISASKLLVYPGEEVILNGKGASIFVWNSDDGVVNNFAGPQLVARPTKTTTYTTTGSGLPLCNTEAKTTIYIRDNVVGIKNEYRADDIHIYPNPGTGKLNVTLENSYLGEVSIRMISLWGRDVLPITRFQKTGSQSQITLNSESVPQGMYIIQVAMGDNLIIKNG